MRSRIYPLVRKEFIQAVRDVRTLIMIVAMPSVMLLLFGYALTTDVKHLPTVVWDQDKSFVSRDFIDKFRYSGYFDVDYYVDKPSEMQSLIDGGMAKVGIVIPRDFSSALISNNDAAVQVILDGSESNTATVAMGYVDAISQTYTEQMLIHALRGAGIRNPEALLPIDARTRVWYNPDLKSLNFLIPGILCALLMIIVAALTAVSVVRENEKGTMEGLLVSPLKRYELILGKIIPPIFIAYVMFITSFFIATQWFRLPVKGNILLLFVLGGVFIVCSLGTGLFISTVARSQRETILMNFAINFLPTVLLSGFMFPISSMPRVLQYITYVVPARYFIVILRGIMLKGVGFTFLWRETLALLLFGGALVGFSILRFRKRLKY